MDEDDLFEDEWELMDRQEAADLDDLHDAIDERFDAEADVIDEEEEFLGFLAGAWAAGWF